MSAIGIVDRHEGEKLDEKTVRRELEGNFVAALVITISLRQYSRHQKQ